ncbi:Hydroxyacylglutathione hydrolase cytoplasmic [Glycine soja]|uniref:Hydroxyacylglutathione hydrolase cytoplasmic n=1 Tax=Glycine soja TaxID=3848 RepID=A0A0B2QVY6_GLYSO|nr:Hydroxyacylglutathione hydrolase cytoplasmic [Glycine soja]
MLTPPHCDVSLSETRWVQAVIVDESTKEGAVVDPVEPQKVLEAANSHGVNNLKLVLTTHHHGDHAGGNEKIKQLVLGMKVYGGSMDNIKGCTDKVENGDKMSLGADINILCLHTPCKLCTAAALLTELCRAAA